MFDRLAGALGSDEIKETDNEQLIRDTPAFAPSGKGRTVANTVRCINVILCIWQYTALFLPPDQPTHSYVHKFTLWRNCTT